MRKWFVIDSNLTQCEWIAVINKAVASAVIIDEKWRHNLFSNMLILMPLDIDPCFFMDFHCIESFRKDGEDLPEMTISVINCSWKKKKPTPSNVELYLSGWHPFTEFLCHFPKFRSDLFIIQVFISVKYRALNMVAYNRRDRPGGGGKYVRLG